jgi:hypothetical protein
MGIVFEGKEKAMNQTEANRLATMYHFIKSQVHQADLNMDIVAQGDPEWLSQVQKEDREFCGTAACVFGYFPQVFPERWRYRVFNGEVSCVVSPEGVQFDFDEAINREFGLSGIDGWFIGSPTSYGYADRVKLKDTDGFHATLVSKTAVLRHMEEIAHKYGYTL